MARKTFTATMPDGSTIKRTSENRTYTYTVIGKGCSGWGSFGWCGSRILAEKLLTRWQVLTAKYKYDYTDIQIVAVQETTK